MTNTRVLYLKTQNTILQSPEIYTGSTTNALGNLHSFSPFSFLSKYNDVIDLIPGRRANIIKDKVVDTSDVLDNNIVLWL